MRLIDADAMYAEWLGDGENEYVYDTNAVLESIDSQPTVESPQWIPVTELLPKKWKYSETSHKLYMIDYLAYSQADGAIYLANWYKPAQRWLVNGESVAITHWMPLPQAPKEDEDEKV